MRARGKKRNSWLMPATRPAASAASRMAIACQRCSAVGFSHSTCGARGHGGEEHVVVQEAGVTTLTRPGVSRRSSSRQSAYAARDPSSAASSRVFSASAHRDRHQLESRVPLEAHGLHEATERRAEDGDADALHGIHARAATRRASTRLC
jgi:hypothetical protein